jgi:sarcosine oxidase
VAGAPARLSAASACRAVPEMAGRAAPQQWRDHLAGRFAALLADFDPAAVTGAADGYYLTDGASGGPLLAGQGPKGPVWAYAACGGMSFKFAPLIARVLADRAVGRPPRPTGLDPVDHPRPLTARVTAGT